MSLVYSQRSIRIDTMPRHESFQAIYESFIQRFGRNGEQRYYAWINENGLVEEAPIAGQKKRSDAVVGNYKRVLQQLSQLITSEKQAHALIVEKWVTEAFDTALRDAARELSLQPNDLSNFRGRQEALDTLKANTIVINSELFDSIEKELTLFLTNKELAGVPITNREFREEITRVFAAKLPRLESQVITETNRVASTALQVGYKQSGLVVAKQWVAIIDNKTTGICLKGNGEIVPLGEPFSTGDYTSPFHINCRSSIASVTISAQNLS